MRNGFVGIVMLLFLAGLGAAQEHKGKGKEEPAPFKEPTEVLGKTFKEWVKEIHARDPSHRDEAIQAVVAFGPDRAYEAVPEILKEINKHKTFNNVDLAVRVNGIVTISAILRHQKQLDKELMKEAFATYKMCLHDTQAIMRVRAVQGLPALGPIAHEGVEDVINLCRDPASWELRKEALQTLTIIGFDAKGTPTPKLLPELKRALEDQSVQVRLTALNALGLVSHASLPKAEEAAILLKLNSHLTVEPDKVGVIWTHVAIMSAAKEVSKKHVGAIAAELKDADPKVRNQALAALASVGAKAKPWALPAIEEALDDPDPSIGVKAIIILVSMQATESIPALEKIANNRKANRDLREHAEDAVDHLKQMSKTKEK